MNTNHPSFRLTMLNAMAGSDIETSMRRQAAWNIRDLDLKDNLYGKTIENLGESEARDIAALAVELGQSTYCFSTVLLGGKIENLLTPSLAAEELSRLRQLLPAARVLQPHFIRLLAPATSKLEEQREALHSGNPALDPLFHLYAQAIDLITEAGFHATIENEAHGCLLGSSDDVVQFFKRIDRAGRVCFTWDVQNFWQMGTFPSLDVYYKLRPLIGFYHVKGGRVGETGTGLQWRTTLEEASWPVLSITQAVIEDGVSPVICLNPSHGAANPQYSMDQSTLRDLEFLRKNFSQLD